MHTLAQVEEAFDLFRRASPGEKLDLWFCDRGLCVFKVPPPDQLPAEVRKRIEDLSWRWCADPHEFGDCCWYLFRSD